MKFLDLFAGIGGFRLGMESAGHECIGFCEIDKFARASYKAIHDTKGEIELHDITRVTDESIRRIGRVDIICGGFPCQAFSIAGNRRGFEDTRGTLFFEIARFASILRPQYLFLENVKGLLNHENGITFETIISTLDELGYDVEWQVLNSKNFGVPQNRERVFIIGHLRGECTRRVFPLSKSGQQVASIKEQYSNTITTRYGNSQGAGAYIVESKSQKVRSIGNIHPSGKGMNGDVYDSTGLAPTLTTNKGEGVKIIQRAHGYNRGGEHDIAPTLTRNSYHENNVLKITEATSQGYAEAEVGDSVNLSHPNSKTRRGRVGKKIANTLLTGESQGVVDPDFRIRKLTPRECWRLQGFPDWAFDKAQEVNSNSQLYKQAGNSVTVNVIAAIAKELE
ncbi:DNA cytosine methyltransferase [Streptococcus oralis]|uniref:DNA cytosine methyltransferase n=1 Tax=Streptococcus oralis TaxID=1303 RepID=UPI002000D050|nr:DNA cytosine methyltransferase [Streptococcus oralis]